MVLEPKFLKFQRRFQKNETTAIVSGSGKTTLIALLQNLYPIKGKFILGI
jgi:ATP-binding cassette subfamily B protein